jgi:alpha-methylacyl-CoA racemase
MVASWVAGDRMGVLSGFRIVEMDGLGPVPLCGMLLADHGAEVIRVARAGTPLVDRSVGGEILHRGRPMVTLDLKSPADRDALLDLVTHADGLMEGFRPGVMERLGLGPDVCQALNPRLVYARMTGWGQTGPLAPRAGHDINYIAMTGALDAIGPADRPVPPLNLVGDYAGGTMFLAFGLLAGLLGARSTGQGKVVDVAMCDAVPILMSLFHAFGQSGGWRESREDNLLDGGAPFYRCYRCRDGRFMAVGALEPQFYAAMMRGLGLDPAEWSQFDRARWPALTDAIAGRFLVRDRDDWDRLFRDIDACVSPVLTMTQAASTAHLVARGTFRTRGDLVEAAPAPRFAGEPVPVAAAVQLTVADLMSRWSPR